MGRPIIKITNLGKKYCLGEVHSNLLSERIGNSFGRLLKKKSGQETLQEFWALKDVSFEVQPGDVVGIIGRNGAGKSTLLKILSRITPPTTGEVEMLGRVASLLEVGTGFHPELTGRENIFLNGAILGMSKAEIREKFDEIVAFAEVEKFIDTPVKRYSSGMYVRLAFAVAAHLDPEILIVDEVLAVGDAEFQKKCLGKMQDVSKEGRTVLFVSHNMGAVKKLCSSTIILNAGLLDYYGKTSEGINHYLSMTKKIYKKKGSSLFVGPMVDKVSITSIHVNGRSIIEDIFISPDTGVVFRVEGSSMTKINACDVIIWLEKEGINIAVLYDSNKPELLDEGAFCSEFAIPPFFLRPGVYHFSVDCMSHKTKEWIYAKNIGRFEILEEWNDRFQEHRGGVINLPFTGKRFQG